MCAKKSDKAIPEEKEIAEGDTSKSILTSALKGAKDEHYNYTKQKNWVASTGSLTLDLKTGGVKPSLWRLAGYSNAGKSPAALEIVRNILTTVPKAKCLWFIAEGRGLSEENRARSCLKFVETVEEWDTGTILVIKTNVFELFVKIVKDLVTDNPNENVYAFIVDSIDGLILRADASKEITEANKVAGVPSMSKKMLQSLSLGMFTHGHWMGMISQVTSEIKIDPYAKTTNRGGQFSGGNALIHGSDVILQFESSYAGDFILDNEAGKLNDGKTKPIGQNVKVTLIKSLLEETKKTSFTYPIKYGRKPGVWIEREVADFLLGFGLLEKGGAWFTCSAKMQAELKEAGIEFPTKIQGFNNVYAELEENKAACEFYFKRFNILSVNSV